MTIRRSGIAAVLLCMSVSGAYAGNEHGNGTDTVPFGTGSAWFLGEGKPIRSCYRISPNFGVPKELAQSAVEAAFEVWARYVKDRRIDLSVMPELRPQCLGDEDLTFYFGGTSNAIEAARTKYENPVAFAERGAQDLASGWSKGFIWIREPDKTISWSDPRVLQGILLHEIGHVLGCSHVAFTIMDAKLHEHLEKLSARSGDAQAAAHLDRIDQERELVMNPSKLFAFRGALDWPYQGINSLAAFERLTGRKNKGTVLGTLTQTDRELVGKKVYRLVLQDEVGPTALEMIYLDTPAVFYGDPSSFAFQRCSRSNGTATCRQENSAPAEVVEGDIQAYDGSRYRFTLTRNASAGMAKPVPAALNMISSDGGATIFKAWELLPK